EDTTGSNTVQISSKSNAISNVNNISFNDCIIDSQSVSGGHFYFTGYPKGIKVNGGKVYSEGGGKSNYIINCPSGNYVDLSWHAFQFATTHVAADNAFMGGGASVKFGEMIGCSGRAALGGPELKNFATETLTFGGGITNTGGVISSLLLNPANTPLYLGLKENSLADSVYTSWRSGPALAVHMESVTSGSPGTTFTYTLEGVAVPAGIIQSGGSVSASADVAIAIDNPNNVRVKAVAAASANTTGRAVVTVQVIRIAA
ncbi:MAG: hypothetical protein COA78_38835, partial [Blastopirellula sp.]